MEIDPKLVAVVANIGAWFWSDIVKEVGKEVGQEVIKLGVGAKWNKFKFNKAKQKYQNRVRELYSTMRVLYKFETVPLDDYYVDLFILEKPEAYRRYGIEYLESNFDETMGFYNQGNRSEALLIANQYDRLFVLGKPGAGKTTFLKYLSSLAAEEKIDKVPVLISFNNWAYSQKNLFGFMVEQFDICGFPEAGKFIELLLEKGKLLLLFDGLDEVSEQGGQRGQLIYELENLIKHYPDNQFMITCRNAANDYKFDGFTYVEIADLTDYQVSIFVKKWFSNNSSKSTDFLTELAKEEHQNLKELSHNPLLLGMLCLVFEETLRFPSKRGIVYKEATDALIKRWDKERGVQRDKIMGFSPAFEKKLLSFLAYSYSLENKIFFEQDDIEKKIEAGSATIATSAVESENILTAIEIQHGLLAQRARCVYTFSHLTFQEYFTAQYINDHLEAQPSLLDDLFQNLYNSRWREVFPLVAGLMLIPDPFIKRFVTHIREPIKKHKTLVETLKKIDGLAVSQGNDDIITSRMRTISLAIVISRIVHIVRNSANKRPSRIAHRLLKYLNLDESAISIESATSMAELLIMGLSNERNNREKINKAIKLAVKQSYQTDIYIEDSNKSAFIDFDVIRINLREQLKKFDEELTQQSKQNIGHAIESNLLIGLSLRIVLDFRPNFINDFIRSITELGFPKTFATEEDWYRFDEQLIQSIAPAFRESILPLKEEYLPTLELFLKSNIFLLDCLRQTNVTYYSDYIFSLNPYRFSRI